MGLLKLRLTMLGTLALIIGFSTLVLAVILSLLGALNLFTLITFVLVINVIQWLFAPKMINAMYRVREVSESENPRLYNTVKNLSSKLGLKMPKVVIANLPIPNAFAYGSPLTGNMVAVTSGLLKELEAEEVEAVLGHELGHLKHKDVQVMMFASMLPAIFYYIGYSLMLSGMYGGYRRNGGAGSLALVGLGCLAVYWLLTLLVLGLSRLREYYADRTSAVTVEDGARKLSEALAKIVALSSRHKLFGRGEGGQLNAFKALFIEDPDRAAGANLELNRARFRSDQQLVREILSRKLTFSDRLAEVFSTHPNIVKRLRALQEIQAAAA